MNFDRLTDSDIAELIETPKRVTNPGAKWKAIRGSRQKDYMATGNGHRFRLFLRQSDYDRGNFSCGLTVVLPDS